MTPAAEGRAPERTGPSWWDRLLLSMMGPPQIGENRAPDGYVPDPTAELCTKCDAPWDRHERVYSGTFTYTRCPAKQS
jgi:hypothetical protein